MRDLSTGGGMKGGEHTIDDLQKKRTTLQRSVFARKKECSKGAIYKFPPVGQRGRGAQVGGQKKPDLGSESVKKSSAIPDTEGRVTANKKVGVGGAGRRGGGATGLWGCPRQ